MDVVYSFATSRLLAQMIGFADERSPDPDRDGSFLLHVLLRPEILQCFLLLYARKIDELPFELDCSDLSALSTQLDRHADVFQHLLLLLDRQPAFVAQFSRLVPSPAALFRDFHLSVARGFALLRAVCDSEALLSSASSPLPPCCDVWSEPFAAALQRLYPASLWASLEFRGFVCFWMLRYADVEQPAQCYAGYRAQVDARIERREKERGAARGDRALARQLARLRQQREALLSDEKAGQTHIETLEVGFFFRGESIAEGDSGGHANLLPKHRRDSSLHPVLHPAAPSGFADGRAVRCPVRAETGALAHAQLRLHHLRATLALRSDAAHPRLLRVRDAEPRSVLFGALRGPLADERQRARLQGVERRKRLLFEVLPAARKRILQLRAVPQGGTWRRGVEDRSMITG